MKIFLGLFVIFISIRNAMAGDIVDWYTSDDNVLEFNGYLNRIHSGVVLTAGSPDSNIILTESMDIQNQGTIYGNLVANNDNWVRINNTGTITGYIIAQHVTQIITSGAGATRLNVISNDFSVKVDGASDGVNLVDLMGLGSRSIEFNQSVIIVDNFSDWQNWDALISWTGTNTLDIRDVTTIESGTYVRNIYGNTVNVLLSDENKLYRLEKIYDVHGLMLNVVRETDYQKIFDDNRGSFLETLRINNPNDKMLMAMDAAKKYDRITKYYEFFISV